MAVCLVIKRNDNEQIVVKLTDELVIALDQISCEIAQRTGNPCCFFQGSEASPVKCSADELGEMTQELMLSLNHPMLARGVWQVGFKPSPSYEYLWSRGLSGLKIGGRFHSVECNAKGCFLLRNDNMNQPNDISNVSEIATENLGYVRIRRVVESKSARRMLTNISSWLDECSGDDVLCCFIE